MGKVVDFSVTLKGGLGAVSAVVAMLFNQLGDFFPILLGLMLADIVLGLLVAFDRRTISSAVSRRGMTMKIGMLIQVGVAALIEPLLGGVDASTAAIGFFCFTELVSIVENAADLGLQIPPILKDALLTLNKQDKHRGKGE